MIKREINPEVRIADDKAGIVQYIASDQSIDAQGEVVRVDGWRFDRFQKNSPLVDSHRYGSSIGAVLGKVIDFQVQNRQLVETAQWAIDVPENTLAKLGFEMTKAGYLSAVSVGFIPEFIVTQTPQDSWGDDWGGAGILQAQTRKGKEVWDRQMQELGFGGARRQPQTVYMLQQQIELSACVIGANANALAKSYKAGLLNDSDLEMISTERIKRETASMTLKSSVVMQARQRKRQLFLDELEKTIKGL